MPAFTMRTYQENALDAITRFFTAARAGDIAAAFTAERAYGARYGRSDAAATARYRPVAGLDAPYACIRIPTGGGKTILAAYAIPRVADAYLDQTYPAVLWIVPSTVILEQTLAAMRDPNHPYRVALNDAFGTAVRIFGMNEITTVEPAMLGSSACIFVATIQAFRTSSTDGRLVYEHHEAFEQFAPFLTAGDTTGLEVRDDGAGPRLSFANILRRMRPIVIVDEAHNARTSLTFRTLERLAPAAILEFTATPRDDSNVLFSVGARDLRDAGMIKLPIILTEHRSWENAVASAVAERARLEAAAIASSDHVRPIVLFQARSSAHDLTPDALRAHLIDDELIPPEQIAIATGEQRDLAGVDLFAATCPIRYIITIAALREGWDCSYAYVLCSVDEVRSSTVVEQLLGRVLRMPEATRRASDALNHAYAHVVSATFEQAAVAFEEGVINLGFEAAEFCDIIQPHQTVAIDPQHAGLHAVPLRVPLGHVPSLPAGSTFTVAPDPIEGFFVVTPPDATTAMPQPVRDAILAAATTENRASVEAAIDAHERWYVGPPPSAFAGETLRVPRLGLRIDGALELIDSGFSVDGEAWDMSGIDASLPNYRYDEASRAFVVDLSIDGRRLTLQRVQTPPTALLLPNLQSTYTRDDAVRYFATRVSETATTQTRLVAWFVRVVDALIARGVTIDAIMRDKSQIAKAVVERLRFLRHEAVKIEFEQRLFGDETAVEASDTLATVFAEGSYEPHAVYRGRTIFTKHFFDTVGDLEESGEEFDCAKVIDGLDLVRTWVRNISTRPATSFWLPTSTDRHYPDFIAQLHDGRFVAIEYKGGRDYTNADSIEKRTLGELWERRSGGTCRYIMLRRVDDGGRPTEMQLRDALAA